MRANPVSLGAPVEAQIALLQVDSARIRRSLSACGGTQAGRGLREYKQELRCFPALQGVSFDLREGEVFGFIGPNGAGKTTTMKILVGLLSDFTGSLSVEGLSMPGHRAALYRMVGYMPQGIAFQDWRTVDHALSTFGRLSGMNRASLAERIPRILHEVGLDGTRDRKVIHLSGGMVQKLGLAQALLHEPKLLVLDEPVAGLDPASRIQVKAILAPCGTGAPPSSFPLTS